MQNSGSCSSCNDEFSPSVLGVIAFIHEDCIAWLCKDCIRFGQRSSSVRHNAPDIEMAIRFFRQLAHNIEYESAVFCVGEQVVSPDGQTFIELLQRILPLWRNYSRSVQERVDGLRVRQLRQMAISTGPSAFFSMLFEHRLLNTMEFILARERLAQVEGEEHFWHGLLSWVEVELNSPLIEASKVAVREIAAKQSADSITEEINNLTQVLDSIRQAWGAVPVTHPAFQMLADAFETASKYDDLIMNSLHNKWGSFDSSAGDSHIGSKYLEGSESYDFYPADTYEKDDAESKSDYDDHDFEDRDPYY